MTKVNLTSWLSEYSGDHSYLLKMKADLAQFGSLTENKRRVVEEIYRETYAAPRAETPILEAAPAVAGSNREGPYDMHHGCNGRGCVPAHAPRLLQVTA